MHEYTKAGTHTITIRAVKEGEPPKTSVMTLTITVEPGPLDHVTIETTTLVAELAKQQQFNATVRDRFDNPIPGLTFTFRLVEQTGLVDSQGMFVAGTKAGLYEDAVTVEVTQGTITKTATADVTIEPGPLCTGLVLNPPERQWRSPKSCSSPLRLSTSSTI